MKNTSLVSFKFIVRLHTHTRSSCLEGEGNRLFTSEAGFANLLACKLKGRILAVMSSHYMDQITVLDLNMMTFFHQWNSSARKCKKYSAYNSGSFPFSIVDEWCSLRTVACWHIVALNPRASAPISDSFSFYDAYIGKVTYNSWTAILNFNRARVMRTRKKTVVIHDNGTSKDFYESESFCWLDGPTQWVDWVSDSAFVLVAVAVAVFFSICT